MKKRISVAGAMLALVLAGLSCVNEPAGNSNTIVQNSPSPAATPASTTSTATQAVTVPVTLPVLDALMGDGLVTIETVRVIHYRGTSQ